MRLPARLGNRSQARAGVGRWITFYNHQRPHAAYGGQPPAVVYFNASETDQQVQGHSLNHTGNCPRDGSSSLTLSEIGHLREIAEHYAYATGNEGAFRRLSNQMTDEARKVRSGSFSYDFEAVYDFGYFEFSHGDGVVSGEFSGKVSSQDGLLRIAGESRFRFTDRFEDPVNRGIEVGGDPYDITGKWAASFSAEVFADSKASEFTAS